MAHTKVDPRSPIPTHAQPPAITPLLQQHLDLDDSPTTARAPGVSAGRARRPAFADTFTQGINTISWAHLLDFMRPGGLTQASAPGFVESARLGLAVTAISPRNEMTAEQFAECMRTGKLDLLSGSNHPVKQKYDPVPGAPGMYQELVEIGQSDHKRVHTALNAVCWYLNHNNLKDACPYNPEDFKKVAEVNELLARYSFRRAKVRSGEEFDPRKNAEMIEDYHFAPWYAAKYNAISPEAEAVPKVCMYHTPIGLPSTFDTYCNTPAGSLFAGTPIKEYFRGMTANNLIVVQRESDARNLLENMSAQGIKVDRERGLFQYESMHGLPPRWHRVIVAPVSVNFEAFQEEAKTPHYVASFQKRLDEQGLSNSKLAMMVDRCDPAKNPLGKLSAIRMALEKDPSLPEKRAGFVFVSPLSRPDVPGYRELYNATKALAEEINAEYQAKWGYKPIVFIGDKGLDHGEVMAGYAHKNVITMFAFSDADGFHLGACEFLSAKDGAEGMGCPIISYGCGSADLYGEHGAIVIDDFHDTNVVSDTVVRVFNMSDEELRERYKKGQRAVKIYDAGTQSAIRFNTLAQLVDPIYEPLQFGDVRPNDNYPTKRRIEELEAEYELARQSGYIH